MLNMKEIKGKNRKGFTLIELIIVIAILGILALIAIPRLGGFSNSAKIATDKAAAEIVEKSFEMAIASEEIPLGTADINLEMRPNGDIVTPGTTTVATFTDPDTGVTRTYNEVIDPLVTQKDRELRAKNAQPIPITIKGTGSGQAGTVIVTPPSGGESGDGTLSSNAGLTSVAGQTDSTVSGTGADAAHAVMWDISVPNTKSTISLSDISVAAYATFNLYTNSSFSSGEITGSSTINLSVGNTLIYIKVIAQDSTTKYYAVTITRLASGGTLSTDAGLTSVAGQTDSTVSGTGADDAHAVMWDISVPNTKSTISLSDISVAAYATFNLYTNSSFSSGEITGTNTTPLPEGNKTVYIKVTAQNPEITKYYQVTITRAARSSDAGIVSVAGQTDSSPGGGNGSNSGTTGSNQRIVWDISVANATSTLGKSDIIVATGASLNLYTNSNFSGGEITGTNTTPLPEGNKTVYIKVTAQNPEITKYYQVTITRAARSSDAGIVSVAGQTDSSPGGGNGSNSGTTGSNQRIVWDISVANAKTTIGRSDIEVAALAEFNLYSDAFSNEITSPNAIPLASGAITSAYVKVTAENGTVRYYEVKITRTAPTPSNLISDNFNNQTLSGWTADTPVTFYRFSGSDYGVNITDNSITKSISTSGYENIRITFYRSARMDSGDHLYVSWYNGSTWSNISNTTGNQNGKLSIDIPGGANNSLFQIKFSSSDLGYGEYVIVDDIELTGTPQ